MVNDRFDQETTTIRDDRVVEVPNRIARTENRRAVISILMGAVSRNFCIIAIVCLWRLPDLTLEAFVVSIVVSADSLVVEELISSSEVLEEFKIETRKA